MVKNNLLIKQAGFTLLEVLVTITIIGLIIIMGLFSYTQVFTTSRDSTRKTDLQVISNALEQYKSAKGSYPSNLTNISIYLNPIPSDPKTKQDYIYNALPPTCVETIEDPCTSYTLTTTLEKNSETYTLNPYGKE